MPHVAERAGPEKPLTLKGHLQRFCGFSADKQVRSTDRPAYRREDLHWSAAVLIEGSTLNLSQLPSNKMSQFNTVLITAGPYQFLATFENAAPQTVAMFRKLLPYHQKLIHVRWSGEGMWVPLGETDFGVPFENHTAHPAAGHILLYPGGISETEFLFCYGGVAFASRMGTLAANHFLTITEGIENLRLLGEMVLWKGAQDVTFEIADEDS